MPESSRAAEIQPPEPHLTLADLLSRARALRETLRGRQALCEAQGRLPEETHRQFLEAGFYRTIQPRRFGGYELDLPSFIQIMTEVSRGCMESGWVLTLTAGHPIFLVKFPLEGQREGFGPTGDFRAPGVATPAGSAIPVSGGYRVKAAWDYASGCDVSSHFLGATFLRESETAPPQGILYVLVDRKDYTIGDNWHVMGMQGTGSRRVVLEETFVPAHCTIQFADARGQQISEQPGHALYRNPLYHGPILPFLIAELGAVAVGGARGALDIYEGILRTKKVALPPFALRSEVGEYQRHFGQAQAWIDVAEGALLKAATEYMDHARRQVE